MVQEYTTLLPDEPMYAEHTDYETWADYNSSDRLFESSILESLRLMRIHSWSTLPKCAPFTRPMRITF